MSNIIDILFNNTAGYLTLHDLSSENNKSDNIKKFFDAFSNENTKVYITILQRGVFEQFHKFKQNENFQIYTPQLEFDEVNNYLNTDDDINLIISDKINCISNCKNQKLQDIIISFHIRNEKKDVKYTDIKNIDIEFLKNYNVLCDIYKDDVPKGQDINLVKHWGKFSPTDSIDINQNIIADCLKYDKNEIS